MTTITRNPITCLFCHIELGKSVIIENTEFLQLSGVLCREVRGVCPNCGKPFYWSVSDKTLQKLDQLIKKAGSNML